jgi:Protein of unknown function (DUF1553)/Protein of unknown function (DUF1549)
MICPAMLLTSLTLLLLPPATTAVPPAKGVSVELIEGIPDKRSWDFQPPEPTIRYTEPAFGFVAVPTKYSARGNALDRTNPFLLRARAEITLPVGKYRFLLRSRGAARLFLDNHLLIQNGFRKGSSSGHAHVPDLPATEENGLVPPAVGSQEQVTTTTLTGGKHSFRLEVIVGGQKVRLELGEVQVGIARPGEGFRLLAPSGHVPLTDEGWDAYAEAGRARHIEQDRVARQKATVQERQFWAKRHVLARKLWESKPSPAIPQVSDNASVHNDIDRFINHKLEQKKVRPAPLADDLAFLRRVTLDTVGVIPTQSQVEAFLADRSPQRKARVIDRLLADPRWADHQVPYWQDVLAENPGILKPTLNNTGPFRWWLHQAFSDNYPLDRFATELVVMEGSALGGAPAGFGMATQNDVPMAAKAHILARAFLGVELGCARCHDAPNHPYKQQDLFSLAALLRRGPQPIPSTSSVRLDRAGRRPRVEVTLKPGTRVKPAWPFRDLAPAEPRPDVLRNSGDTRERLAAILTSPHNERFAQVAVNRLWKRYLGWGLVELVDDWNKAEPSHPELLRFLARELVTHGYDLKHVSRLILSSHTYQREIRPEGSKEAHPEDRLFASPARRRMTAEQLVDSLFLTAGKDFNCEELTLDPDGRRAVKDFINLGRPRRAWEFTSLSNERDRPALALPVAQGIVDLLVAYGWRDSRPNPITVRDDTPTPLQPLVLANGLVGSRITRLSDDSAFTRLALEERPLPDLIRAIYLRALSRLPTARETALFEKLLAEGYETRKVPGAPVVRRPRPRSTAVSWSNHLSPEATTIKLELERQAREGDPPTRRLATDWRERLEDMLWALVNSPEFVFVP